MGIFSSELSNSWTFLRMSSELAATGSTRSPPGPRFPSPSPSNPTGCAVNTWSMLISGLWHVSGEKIFIHLRIFFCHLRGGICPSSSSRSNFSMILSRREMDNESVAKRWVCFVMLECNQKNHRAGHYFFNPRSRSRLYYAPCDVYKGPGERSIDTSLSKHSASRTFPSSDRSRLEQRARGRT